MNTNITAESFKTTFNINTDTSDVNFQKVNVEPYNPLPQTQNHQFGEKICLLYRIELTVFNVKVILRILAFKYNEHAEVLKLEIRICNDILSKEIAPCKNFLQRKRNINLAFEVLRKFAQLFETRRLICLTVFEKQESVIILFDEAGINVKCCNNDFTTKYLELNWSIMWKLENYEVSDFVEFYLNYSVLQKHSVDKIKDKLEVLVESNVGFHSKLKLWRSLMEDLYGRAPSLKNSSRRTRSADVLEILDSDSDDSVIEVDRNVYDGPGGDEIMVID